MLVYKSQQIEDENAKMCLQEKCLSKLYFKCFGWRLKIVLVQSLTEHLKVDWMDPLQGQVILEND